MKCVSIIEHLEIHLSQKEYTAAFAIMIRLDEDEKQKYFDIDLPKLAASQRDNSNIGFNNPKNLEKALATQRKMIEEEIHPLQNIEMHKQENARRVKLGIHNFQSQESIDRVTAWNKDMIKQGTHPFQNRENRSDWVEKFVTCSYCGYVGRGACFKYNHEEYCRDNPENKRIICEYCGNSHHPTFYKRYHGEKCKSKTSND